MLERKRIYNKTSKLNDEDGISLAALLLKAGYSVKIGSEQAEGKRQKIYFVEFWEE